MVRKAECLALAASILLVAGCASVTVSPAVTRAGTGTEYSALKSGYPASFVGSVLGGCPKGIRPALCQGLTVFSAVTGRPLRALVGLKAAFAPEVLQHPHVVYYYVDGQGKNCENLMRIPYRGGRPARIRRFTGTSLGAFAVSADGKMIAYQVYPLAPPSNYGCDSAGLSRVLVVNKATGARHTITRVPGPIFDMAWSPNDKALAVELASGTYASSAVRVLSSPFSIRHFNAAALPCPGRAQSCLQFSPHYDRTGQIFYIAGLPANGSADQKTEPPCGQTCRYVLTRVTGTHAVALASVTGLNRSQASAWCTVGEPGSAAVLTVPYGRGFATFRYSDGHLTRLKYAVADVSW